MAEQADAVVIGAGFYGLSLAIHLRERHGFGTVTVLERESGPMRRASYVNQARVHNGYHYPRSVLTAHRSAVSYRRFTDEFHAAIVARHQMYYGVAAFASKVAPPQFEAFCMKIGSPLIAAEAAEDPVAAAMNADLVGGLWKVTEAVFDAAVLTEITMGKVLATGGIDIRFGVAVDRIEPGPGDCLTAVSGPDRFRGGLILNCAYSGINALNARSGLALHAFKHEITEMALVSLPPELRGIGVTVMDGPFFSLMPFPDRGLHTLSHVRYTPHGSWLDTPDSRPEPYAQVPYDVLDRQTRRSAFPKMRADVTRYFPALSAMAHEDSLWEVKTVLRRSEDSDSRPILFAQDPDATQYVSILGGKIDNIYDAQDELDEILRRMV